MGSLQESAMFSLSFLPSRRLEVFQKPCVKEFDSRLPHTLSSSADTMTPEQARKLELSAAEIYEARQPCVKADASPPTHTGALYPKPNRRHRHTHLRLVPWVA